MLGAIFWYISMFSLYCSSFQHNNCTSVYDLTLTKQWRKERRLATSAMLSFPEGHVVGYILDHISRGKKGGMSGHGKALGKFTLYIDMGDVSPESVKAHVKDKVITITGNRAEITEENDGMIRCNYHGFTNKLSLPEGTDPDTLKLTTPDGYTLVVEVAYRGIPFPKSKNTSGKKDLFFATWSETTNDPLPSSRNCNETESEPGSPTGERPSTSDADGEAKAGRVHIVLESAEPGKVSSIPTAYVAPIRRVSFIHDGPSVFVFNNQPSSQSIEMPSADKMKTE